jgi:hypothetical protein
MALGLVSVLSFFVAIILFNVSDDRVADSFLSVPFVLMLPAMVTGIGGLVAIHRRPAALRGRWCAWLGTSIGVLFLAMMVAFFWWVSTWEFG